MLRAIHKVASPTFSIVHINRALVTLPLITRKSHSFNLLNGDSSHLPATVRNFIDASVRLCEPEAMHICDGSETENSSMLSALQRAGTIVPLPKYDNCWLARTNPADVARVESRTFMCTDTREEAVCTTKTGVTGMLGNWISPQDYERAIAQRFPGSMRNRTMFVIPFSMGPIGSPLSKIGVEITDSPYVVASMRIMTRMGAAVMDELCSGEDIDFVRCLHSVGRAENGVADMPSWVCDPERTIILHRAASNEIVSYGSAYGGNALLGKKCLALRIGSTIARREGWLAEHMLILGITPPNGRKRYIAAAFPSACGKTNLAMMMPALEGFKVECVGDDIAWMKFDSKGQLRAINPENGFFGVAPGTSSHTNPNAMTTCLKDTLFTNVASTSDGGVYWEGLEDSVDAGVTIADWHGKEWKRGVNKTPAAHPNSRFCAPARNCPIMDARWEDPQGVPISAILFGGRRPEGVPLVYEAYSWQHGVMLGSAMRSEATAAAEHKGKVIMHDPMAMRPFLGYNFGDYLQHWLSMDSVVGRQMPKVFHVNWFRRASDGSFLWPGFGENARVLEWILRRVEGEECFDDTPIGRVPCSNSLRLDGLKETIDMRELFEVDREFWLREVSEIQKFYDEQVGHDLPPAIQNELNGIRERIARM